MRHTTPTRHSRPRRFMLPRVRHSRRERGRKARMTNFINRGRVIALRLRSTRPRSNLADCVKH